ncbi:MAG: hypothetical protein LBU27_08790 [Candidatus Peribacteria bacterium]|jgi:hypothetical protein|nr:hypothetical protein [Candidatus Peribacteria bacterium]
MNNQIGVNLPFTLRTNNATKSISVEVERGTSFQHFLDEVYELDESVQYRVVGEEGISYLDFGYNIGKDLP